MLYLLLYLKRSFPYHRRTPCRRSCTSLASNCSKSVETFSAFPVATSLTASLGNDRRRICARHSRASSPARPRTFLKPTAALHVWPSFFIKTPPKLKAWATYCLSRPRSQGIEPCCIVFKGYTFNTSTFTPCSSNFTSFPFSS